MVRRILPHSCGKDDMEDHCANRRMAVGGSVIFLGRLYFPDELFLTEKLDKGTTKEFTSQMEVRKLSQSLFSL